MSFVKPDHVSYSGARAHRLSLFSTNQIAELSNAALWLVEDSETYVAYLDPRLKGDSKTKFWPCFELKGNSNKILYLGTPIENVHAEDADFGRNAEIQYRISKGAYDDFAINAENGEISLSGELDYVRTHHMFSRILNFLFVIVFVFQKKLSFR